MLAEWSVELGSDDPVLELPWASPEGNLRFLDLKKQPELLLEIREAYVYPELAEFLSWANSPESPLQTAKCDVWVSRQIEAEEEIFGEPCKLGSYIDLVLCSTDARSSFKQNQVLAQSLAGMLRHAPDLSSSAEFIVRRCLSRHADSDAPTEGFYITFYVHGYGEDEQHARKCWAIALKLAQHAIIQHFASAAG